MTPPDPVTGKEGPDNQTSISYCPDCGCPYAGCHYPVCKRTLSSVSRKAEMCGRMAGELRRLRDIVSPMDVESIDELLADVTKGVDE